MRIAFLGTAAFSLPILDRLLESPHTVVGVVTGPDRPAGRGRRLTQTPVRLRAEEAGLPVLTPVKLKDPAFREAYSAWEPEAAVVVAYRILPREVFDLPPLGTLNVHPSLLPRYRGPAPLNWTLINGDHETGVSIIRITETVDAGGVVLQERFGVNPDETSDQLGERAARLGADLVIRALAGLEAGNLAPIPQDEALVTRAPKLSKEDGRILWKQPALHIHNRVRGVHPWPGAWTTLHGKTLKLFRSRPEAHAPVGTPGQVWRAGKTGLSVYCEDGYIVFQEVQLEGKRRMGVEEFLRGYRLEPGERLGE